MFKKVSQGIISFVSKLTSGTIFEIKNDTGDSAITVLSDGKIGINNPAPVEELDVIGDIKASANFRGNGLIIDKTGVGAPVTLDMPFANASLLDGKVGNTTCIKLLGSNNDVGDGLITSGVGILKLKSGSSGVDNLTLDTQGNVKLSGTLKLGQYTGTEAEALTPANGDVIYVTATSTVFTSVGFWGYENGAWIKKVSKQYVDDSVANAGGGDMLKATYDSNNNGIVDDSEKLGGQNGGYYLSRVNHTGTQPVSTITGLSLVAISNDYNDLNNKPDLTLFDNFETFANQADFPVTGVSDVLYLETSTGILFRWDGVGYTEISAKLALGETSSTAYRGDRGKIAYDHSQVTTGNPHSVTKSEIGLGNVDNTSDTNKPVSTAQQTALDGKADAVHTHTLSDITDYQNPQFLTVPAGGEIQCNNLKGNYYNMTSPTGIISFLTANKVAGAFVFIRINANTSGNPDSVTVDSSITQRKSSGDNWTDNEDMDLYLFVRGDLSIEWEFKPKNY